MITNYCQIGFQTESKRVVNPTLYPKVSLISDNILKRFILIKTRDWNLLNFEIFGVDNMEYLDQFGNLTGEYYGYVYCIYNQFSNKVYIGQSCRLKPKLIETYYGSGIRISNLIKKHGKLFLKKIILGVCYSKEELTYCETECKLFFNALDNRYGYNLILEDKFPTTKDTPRSKEHCENISKSKKGKPSPLKGIPQSVEALKKNKESHIGQIPWNKGGTTPP